MWSLWMNFFIEFLKRKTFVLTILAVSVLLRKVERHSLGDRMEPGALKDGSFHSTSLQILLFGSSNLF